MGEFFLLALGGRAGCPHRRSGDQLIQRGDGDLFSGIDCLARNFHPAVRFLAGIDPLFYCAAIPDDEELRQARDSVDGFLRAP